ncbi:hypothetical protein SAMN04488569_100224 [Marinilactibacillus piezotolerans]|uniref:YceG-like family protein n=1 Tax=Marinilactibacillus piezotolerans TaxID=258723 RepID=A0A1I3V3U1_9LACT|nr:hypothetical protein [Marinilactibacillus piezotolerans]SFJ89885.1 hypothetical protein SAMN04488569_100224 [Marinilactibacillus piezotolerans]
MSKKNIRILALGFFISGIILVLTSLLMPGNQSANGQTGNVEELESEITYLEEKIAQLEVAQTSQAETTSEEVEQPANETETSDTEEDASSNEDEVKDESKEEEPEEDPVIKATITIGEGEPSSVAAQQLESESIIEDRYDFDSFLEDNDYAPLVRPGSYEINSEMTYEEIAQKLMGN